MKKIFLVMIFVGGILSMLFKTDKAEPVQTELSALEKEELELKAMEKRTAELKAERERIVAETFKHDSIPGAYAPVDSDQVRKPAVNARSNPVCLFNRDQIVNDVKTYLKQKYPDSYSLQKRLYDSQMKAVVQLCTMSDTLQPFQISLLDKLIKRYYPSWSLIKTLYDKNMEDYYKLNN